MNKRFGISTMALALASLWTVNAAPARASAPMPHALHAAADQCRAGAPVILGGYMLLSRDEPDRVVLGQGGFEFATDRASFGYKSGMWAMLGWRVSDEFMMDASFMGLPQWGEQASIAGDGATPITSPYLNVSGPTVTGLKFDYHSDLHSFDANLRGIIGSEDSLWVSFFGGFRYFNFAEDFDLTGGMGATETAGGAVELTRARTTNRMYGGQFGGDVNGAIGNFFGLSAYAKGGFMANDAESRVSNVLVPDGGTATPRLGFVVRDTIPAYFLEGGLQFLVRLSDTIEVKGGYRFLFLTGLALAPEQLSANTALFGRTILSDSTSSFGDVGVLNRDGNVFFHGPFLGLEFHW